MWNASQVKDSAHDADHATHMRQKVHVTQHAYRSEKFLIGATLNRDQAIEESG